MDLHDVQRAPTRVTRYSAPTTLADALGELAAGHGRARPIAGGTDLLVELDRGGRAGVETLVDLGRIPGLDRITARGDELVLGPLVTHNQVVADRDCVDDALPLAQACLEVGSPQLRNRATVAGNLVTASPANDTISALLALGASVELTSLDGTRTVALGDFFTGFRETVLAPGELVTAIVVPRLGSGRRGVFVKLGLRQAQAISVVHLAAVVAVDGDGRVEDAVLALGSVGPTVEVASAAADALRGRPLTDDRAIADASAAAAAAVTPIDDLRATADYRGQMVATMTTRALTALAAGEERVRWPSAAPRLWGAGFDGRFPVPSVAPTSVSVTAGTVIASRVNGTEVEVPARPDGNLLDWLRDEVGLTGVKEGCAEGECGACTVDLDGAAVMSCLVPAPRAAGAEIVTVEGLADGDLHPIQQAFVDTGAVQCGFCTPGLVVACAKLLEETARPNRDQILGGLSGNLCRCTGYYAIVAAVDAAARSEDR